MDRDDIRAFVHRDWAAVERQKAEFWAERKRTMSAAEALSAAESLRRYVCLVRPSWPDQDERDADLAVHTRVTEALRAVFRHRTR